MTTLDDLLWLWEDRREAGKPVAPEELCADCPELLDQLRWHIKALEAVEMKFGVATSGAAASTPGASSRHDIAHPTVVRMSSEFIVERLHATGGLGAIYLANDPVLNRRVALKFPRQASQSRAVRVRFEREAHITSQLDHPGIVPVHAVNSKDGEALCYATRFVEGRTLRDAIAAMYEQVSVDTDFALRPLLQRFVAVCNIVAFAHDRRIIHRDIKPANVMLGEFGETLLIDWGLAKVLGERSDEDLTELEAHEEPPVSKPSAFTTETGKVMGTPAFASPEQLLGRTADVAERSDVYSLGATLFAILTGTPPTSAQDFDTYLANVSAGVIVEPRDRNPKVPAPLNAICVKAMSVEPKDRYPSAIEMARDIERWLADETVSVLQDPLRVRLGRAVRKKPGLAAATAAGIIVALIAGSVGSAVLSSKNRELSSQNDKLAEAVGNADRANHQTLDALRSLVDDVVIEKFGEQTVLRPAERQFLNSVLAQYQTYSSLQGDSIESRAMRAEGLLQSGRVYKRLSDDIHSLENLNAAVTVFEELLATTSKQSFQIDLASALADISEAQLRMGQVDESEATADRGIQLCTNALPDAPFPPHVSNGMTAALAELYRMKGTIQTRRNKWKDAEASFTKAEDLLDHAVKSEPSNAKFQQNLANICRTLSITCGRMGEKSRQISYSERTMQIQRMLADQFPDDPESKSSLVHALRNHALLLQSLRQHRLAIEELSGAIEIAKSLVDQYPLVARHRETLGMLLSARGTMMFSYDEPARAISDLEQTVEMFRDLVRDFPESFENMFRLEEALYLLASHKGRTHRVKVAEALFSELFALEDRMQQKFPEAAKQSTLRAKAQVEHTHVLLRQGKIVQAHDQLIEAIRDLHTAAAVDQTETSRLAIIKACITLASLHRNRRHSEAASLALQKGADLAADIASSHPADSELLNQLASLHSQFADEFAGLKLDDKVTHHRALEHDIRTHLIASFPEDVDYRMQLARMFVRIGRWYIPRGDFQSCEIYLAQAETILNTARKEFPGDPLIDRTQGEVDRGLGSLLFHMERFPEAMVHFDSAVRLNPTMDHVTSRLRCMAEVRPDQVLEEAHRIEQGELPNDLPLLNLIYGAATAAGKVKDPEELVQLCDVVARLLRYMMLEDYFPMDRTITELKTGRKFDAFRRRPGALQLLERMRQRNEQLTSPILAIINQKIAPAARKFAQARTWSDIRHLGAAGQLLYHARIVANSVQTPDLKKATRQEQMPDSTSAK